MQSLITHYQQLLGLPETWKVSDVRLSMSGTRIAIHLEYIGPKVECPECGNAGRIYDQAPEQRWRHLDTMQYETHLIARIPRCECKEHGVKTMKVPWAAKYSRYTLKF
ncbi:MAG: transposase family protein, partial [Chlorobaculum sp.]|nr:transposase family protein [Chlorobaculum sp.]